MMYEIMLDSELNNVSGGNIGDRWLLINKLKSTEIGKYLNSGESNEELLAHACKFFNIEYVPNTCEQDHFKFAGHDFKTSDFENAKNLQLIENYIKKQIAG